MLCSQKSLKFKNAIQRYSTSYFQWNTIISIIRSIYQQNCLFTLKTQLIVEKANFDHEPFRSPMKMNGVTVVVTFGDNLALAKVGLLAFRLLTT